MQTLELRLVRQRCCGQSLGHDSCGLKKHYTAAKLEASEAFNTCYLLLNLNYASKTHGVHST